MNDVYVGSKTMQRITVAVELQRIETVRFLEWHSRTGNIMISWFERAGDCKTLFYVDGRKLPYKTVIKGKVYYSDTARSACKLFSEKELTP